MDDPLTPELRRQLREIYRAQDLAELRRDRRSADPSFDLPRDDWIREIVARTREAGRDASDVEALRETYRFLLTQLRPGQGRNLLGIGDALLVELADVVGEGSGEAGA